jgi:hypothetical protein
MGDLSCRNFTFTAAEEAPEPNVQCPFCPKRMYIMKNMLFPRLLFQKPASCIDGRSFVFLYLKTTTVRT